ncbi:hypothetical protein ACS2VC_27185, partial [Bacillus cereus group sp. BC241]|uniref:hypothetical protein n=1 Tax=Bacillus cereus group sp. BC241 TaxID=3445333 RepID=UPI003F281A61
SGAGSLRAAGGAIGDNRETGPDFGAIMTADEHQQVIDKLQEVIDDTRQTIERFEATGMETELPEDYDKLLEILDSAVKAQREHTLAMLG